MFINLYLFGISGQITSYIHSTKKKDQFNSSHPRNFHSLRVQSVIAVGVMQWPWGRSVGLSVAAMPYLAVIYLRHLLPAWHVRLEPAPRSSLALIAIDRVPFYKY